LDYCTDSVIICALSNSLCVDANFPYLLKLTVQFLICKNHVGLIDVQIVV
jgi:hypothetical protein